MCQISTPLVVVLQEGPFAKFLKVSPHWAQPNHGHAFYRLVAG